MCHPPLGRTMSESRFLLRTCGIAPLAIALLLLLPGLAQAHYLWLSVRSEGGARVADLVFEESPRPGDGGYLDPIVKRSKTWLRTGDRAEPQELEMEEIKQDGNRWLRGTLNVQGSVTVSSYVKWGVYRYGKTDTLLHYYAKNAAGKQSAPVARDEKLDLDMAVDFGKEKGEVQVFWKGKPAASRTVFVRGPKRTNHKLTTDEKGRAKFSHPGAGFYTFRTSVPKPDESGEFQDKQYTAVRHNATLTVRLAK